MFNRIITPQQVEEELEKADKELEDRALYSPILILKTKHNDKENK